MDVRPRGGLSFLPRGRPPLRVPTLVFHQGMRPVYMGALGPACRWPSQETPPHPHAVRGRGRKARSWPRAWHAEVPSGAGPSPHRRCRQKEVPSAATGVAQRAGHRMQEEHLQPGRGHRGQVPSMPLASRGAWLSSLALWASGCSPGAGTGRAPPRPTRRPDAQHCTGGRAGAAEPAGRLLRQRDSLTALQRRQEPELHFTSERKREVCPWTLQITAPLTTSKFLLKSLRTQRITVLEA